VTNGEGEALMSHVTSFKGAFSSDLYFDSYLFITSDLYFDLALRSDRSAFSSSDSKMHK